ncbi:MAG: ComF family protein [Bacteroidota bacterium]|nr:ComF family protein [Bacteroidota bacterium]
MKYESDQGIAHPVKCLRATALRAAEPFLDFLLPPRCLSCDAVIRAADVLCPACLTESAVRMPTDEDCGALLAGLTYRADVSMIHIGFEFEPGTAIAESIHTMKYRGMHSIGYWFGRLLGEQCMGKPILDGRPVLVPVPLHHVKRLERGFNQAESICRGLSFETGLPVYAHALRRVRYTQSQAAMLLDKRERRLNTLDAFVIDPRFPAVLREHPVIIVDDLITTGATMSDCVMVLRENGVQDIRLLAVARPIPRT